MPITQEQWLRVLDTIGASSQNGNMPLHLDAAYSIFLAQELQAIETQVYRQKYPELKALELFPVTYATPSGALTTVYDMLTEYGSAALIANYADDLPLVDVMKERFTITIQSYGEGYTYSIQDIRAAQMAGTSLDQLRATTARKIAEIKVEEVAADGQANAGLYGALNHPNVPLYTLPTGTWSSASANAIADDMHSLVDQVLDANDDTVIPDTIAMAPASYRRAGEHMTTDGSAKTALQIFLSTNAYIKNVIPWNRCKTADAARTGPRMMCYKRDPEVIQLDIPQPFEQFPPQAINLAFKVPCHIRLAGVKIRYPLGCGYADGM